MLSLSDRSFLYTYLAHTIEAGVHPKEALAAYISDVSLHGKRKEELERALFLFTKKSSLGVALRDARAIPEGESRILAFTKQKSLPYAPALIGLGAHLRARELVKKKARAILVYPAILIGELGVLGTIMVLWLIPQLETLFIKLGVKEPRLVELLAGVGKTIDEFLELQNLPFLFVAPAAIFALVTLSRRERFRATASSIILNAPGIGPLYRLLASEKIFSMLAMIVKDAPPSETKDAIALIAECEKNPLYKKMLDALARALKEQTPLARALHQRKNRRLLPVIAIRMLILGEKRGDIREAISALARILSEELDVEMRRFTSLLEPILVISIALIVGLAGFMIQRIFSSLQGAMIGG